MRDTLERLSLANLQVQGLSTETLGQGEKEPVDKCPPRLSLAIVLRLLPPVSLLLAPFLLPGVSAHGKLPACQALPQILISWRRQAKSYINMNDDVDHRSPEHSTKDLPQG